jgi:glycogen debranching enzyme
MSAAEIEPDGEARPPYFIAVTAAASAAQRPCVLKHGEAFVVLDEFGNAQATGPAAQGLFFEDTRYLAQLVLTVNGTRPLLLSSFVTEDNAALVVDMTNPELVTADGQPLVKDQIHILGTTVLGDGALFQTLVLRNFGPRTAHFRLEIGFSADFADIFETRGTPRARRGAMLPAERGKDGVVLSYRGLDRTVRRVQLGFEPAPDMPTPRQAVWPITLAPSQMQEIEIAVRCSRDGRPSTMADRAASIAAASLARAERKAGVAKIYTSNESFNDWLSRSRADLDMLATETPYGPYPFAGIPWFATAFGRDGIITALQCLWLDPKLAAGTLRFLAAHQATELDPKADAEPGKILHECRNGEMAILGEVPFGRYYGGVDSTPLFVVLAAAYWRRTGDLALIRDIWPHIEAALRWMDLYGDADRDGFLEYDRKSLNGLVNQGWKDSADSVSHEDGTLASAPIALVEVQAYAYAAFEGAAELSLALGEPVRAVTLREAAERLRGKFEAAFWLEDLGTYAMALDGDKRPCRIGTSNAGHVLMAGLASPERAARVAERLLAPASFSRWGIRTLEEGAARYNPMSYHNGSVWPHDNALICMGFQRYRLRDPLLSVLTALFDASLFLTDRRLPELFCGFERRPQSSPTGYPVACLPQAWASAAAFGMLGTILGLSFEPEVGRVRFDRPILPSWMDECRITDLRLGEAEIDLRLVRHGDDVAVHVLRRLGDIEVVITA